ncbi:MAG: PH domain-containing protein [Methanobacteriota archaeon]|nr:MAG: PH domain-containing protein [Euryarchaeota archaeon]
MIALIDIFDPTFPDIVREGMLRYSTILYAFAIVFAIIGSYLYYPTIRYEVIDNEIHVYRGVITKTRKVVPYRTITNIEIKRGIFDRMFGIGTVEIQTAGSSNPNRGPEERIDGIPKDILIPLQEHIISHVRRMTGSPATSHDSDPVSAILYELRELKTLLKEKLQN